jgi:hypothetical protein
MQTKFVNTEQAGGSGSHFHGARTFQSVATPESPVLRANSTPFSPWTLLRHWKARGSGCLSAGQYRNRTLIGTALLAVLSGSVGCVYETRHTRAYAPPPPVYTQTTLTMDDDFIYYPAYEVYYSSSRRKYTSWDGRSWVSSPTPPHVSAEALSAGPSVRMDFHDAPAAHHASVVREYPKHWTPTGQGHGNKEGNERHTEGNGKGNNQRDRSE